MNTGKTLFAQLMDFLPWTTFTRIVDRYGGDHRVRTLSCAEQYRSMAFAQLTYREAGAIYVVDRGYVDFARLYVLHQAGAFFVTRAKSNIDAHRVYSAPTDRSTGIICDQTISLDGFYTRQDYPELLRRIRFKDPESGKTLVFITNNFSLPAATICALYKKPLAGGTLLQVDQAASSDQAVLRHVGERGEDADLDCRLGLRPRRHRQEAPRPGRLALHFVTDPLGDPLRENAHTSSTCGRRKQMQRFANNQPIEFIRFSTGH